MLFSRLVSRAPQHLKLRTYFCANPNQLFFEGVYLTGYVKRKNSMKRKFLILTGLLVFAFANSSVAFSEELVWHQTFSEDQIDAMKKTKAIIHTASGDITLIFFPEVAPNHVYNFIQLSRIGFYDKTLFHRVVPGFVIQGGDPGSRRSDTSHHGQGGPGYGYNLKAEFNDRSHTRGALSMARSIHIDSAGSQFFICVADSLHLNGQYTVFGKVTEGIAAVDDIVSVARDSKDHPLERIEMQVEIISPEDSGVNGDINGDGRIGLEEAIHALQVVSGTDPG